jgi:hypothetical protein
VYVAVPPEGKDFASALASAIGLQFDEYDTAFQAVRYEYSENIISFISKVLLLMF